MNLKEFISKLDKAGDLLRIKRPVSTRYEIAAILDAVDKNTGRAVLFERVRGYTTPVAGNLLSHRRRLALALGGGGGAVLEGDFRRVKRREKPKILPRRP